MLLLLLFQVPAQVSALEQQSSWLVLAVSLSYVSVADVIVVDVIVVDIIVIFIVVSGIGSGAAIQLVIAGCHLVMC